MMEYPKREPFFFARFVRLLTKCAAAMEVGPEGFALLTVIVGQEDACRYTRPVNFWNGQLAALVGLRDPEALRRVRERCIRAGWLQYQPGNKQLPARYFVTIPDAVSSFGDGSSDESPHQSAGQMTGIDRQSRQESAENLPRICRESAEKRPTSIPFPIPNPNPLSPTPLAPEGGEDIASTPQPTPPTKLTVTGRDLWMSVTGMVHAYGRDHGIGCLDAALSLYDHRTIAEAIKARFLETHKVVEADEIVALCAKHTEPPIQPVEVKPLIDVQALIQTGKIVPLESAS